MTYTSKWYTHLSQVPSALSEDPAPAVEHPPATVHRRLRPHLDPRVALEVVREGFLDRDLAGSSDGDDAAAAVLLLPLAEESLLDVDKLRAERGGADDLAGGEDVAREPHLHEAAPRGRGEGAGQGTEVHLGGRGPLGRDLGDLRVHGEGGVAGDDCRGRVGGRGRGGHVLKSDLQFGLQAVACIHIKRWIELELEQPRTGR